MHRTHHGKYSFKDQKKMAPDDKFNSEDFTKITVLENSFEAQLIASILKDMSIPHWIRSYHDTALDGLYQLQKGWGELDAPSEFKDEILKIIDHIRTETT